MSWSFRLFFSERFWLPPLCAVLVLAGLIGGICADVLNRNLGTFRGPIDPKPGQIAQAPILEPHFSRTVSPKLEFELGSNPQNHIERLETALLSGAPDAGAEEELSRELRRPEVQVCVTEFERAAEADVCGWRVLTPDNRLANPSYQNLRFVTRLIVARAASSMLRDDWEAARRDTDVLVKCGSTLGTEGFLYHRMVGVSIWGYGLRTGFLLVHCSPEDQLEPLLEQLLHLNPQVRRLADWDDLLKAEPFLGWPDRLVFSRMNIPGFERAVIVDKANVAKFRLLLLACAARKFRTDHGRLPESAEDLLPLLENRLPIDPFSGVGFAMEFMEDYVRFCTPTKLIPTWFDTQGGKYLPAITIEKDGTVVEQ